MSINSNFSFSEEKLLIKKPKSIFDFSLDDKNSTTMCNLYLI